MKRFLRAPGVREATGLSRTQIDRLEQAGRFPRKVRLGPNCVGWVEDEVSAWNLERIADRDAQAQEAPNDENA